MDGDIKLYVPDSWLGDPALFPTTSHLLPPTSYPGEVGRGTWEVDQNTTLVSLFFSINTPSLMLVTTMIPLSK